MTQSYNSVIKRTFESTDDVFTYFGNITNKAETLKRRPKIHANQGRWD